MGIFNIFRCTYKRVCKKEMMRWCGRQNNLLPVPHKCPHSITKILWLWYNKWQKELCRCDYDYKSWDVLSWWIQWYHESLKMEEEGGRENQRDVVLRMIFLTVGGFKSGEEGPGMWAASTVAKGPPRSASKKMRNFWSGMMEKQISLWSFQEIMQSCQHLGLIWWNMY